MPKRKPTRDITARGTPRKMPLFVHWTAKPGAAKKLALAAKRRRKTVAESMLGGALG